MHTYYSSSEDGNTCAMVGKKGKYMVKVNGRQVGPHYRNKSRAKKAYDLEKRKLEQGTGDRYGEQTMRDALGL